MVDDRTIPKLGFDLEPASTGASDVGKLDRPEGLLSSDAEIDFSG